MIELIPAIDIIDGRCVRLTKGDYATEKVYSHDPLLVAMEMEALGFRRLHVVDLEGARSRHIVNIEVLRRIATETSLIVDFGGGIKSEDDLHKAFDAGAHMVTLGSIAVKEPELVQEWLQTFGAERIVVGADVRNGNVSINGWKEESAIALMPFLESYISRGASHVLCTDISRDGALEGTNRDLYQKLSEELSLNIIASGGVSSLEDVLALRRQGLYGAIVGKAYYEKTLSLRAAIEAAV